MGEALADLRAISHFIVPAPARATWSLGTLAGRLVELSGGRGAPLLTVAMTLVREAQEGEQPVAWVGKTQNGFYPPDAAAAGIDLDALVVVRVADPRQLGRAADQLVRSGAFTLIVIDLGPTDLSLASQTRLGGLAIKHGTAILCLTRKGEARPSLGSLVSLRAHARKKALGDGRFACELRIVKDKRGGPGWTHEEVRVGPDGLR